MKITVLNGSPRTNGNTIALVDSFKKGAESVGHNVTVFNVATMKINGCTGCEYCQDKEYGQCAFKDDMSKIYDNLKDTEMVVFASPVYYWGFTGQLQSTLSRFYAIDRPPKAEKYGLILSSHSPNVYDAILSQYKDVVAYLGGKETGIITAYGPQNKSPEKLTEAYNFGKNL